MKNKIKELIKKSEERRKELEKLKNSPYLSEPKETHGRIEERYLFECDLEKLLN